MLEHNMKEMKNKYQEKDKNKVTITKWRRTVMNNITINITKYLNYCLST